MKAIGRPGKRRATHGRIRAAIIPELKDEIERLCDEDKRIRSVAFLVETALLYWLRDYKTTKGSLDADLFLKLKKS